MYSFLNIFFTLITAFMFLRMHHTHGSDTQTERMIILVGCILFLIQAGLSYQQMLTDRTGTKRIVTITNLICLIGFAVLFFWFVDFERDSIFSTMLGT